MFHLSLHVKTTYGNFDAKRLLSSGHHPKVRHTLWILLLMRKGRLCLYCCTKDGNPKFVSLFLVVTKLFSTQPNNGPNEVPIVQLLPNHSAPCGCIVQLSLSIRPVCFWSFRAEERKKDTLRKFETDLERFKAAWTWTSWMHTEIAYGTIVRK